MKPRSVSLSSAGFGLFTYLGALDELRVRGDLSEVRAYVGCSAGAIAALFLLTEVPFERAIESLETTIAGMRDRDPIATFLHKHGILDGDSHCRALFDAAGVPASLTFAELHARTGIEFECVAFCLNTMDVVGFSRHTHPGLSVRVAVQASASVPFLSSPCRIGSQVFVDGGMHLATPFERASEHRPTLSLEIESGRPRETSTHIDGLASYLRALACAVGNRFMYHQSRSVREAAGVERLVIPRSRHVPDLVGVSRAHEFVRLCALEGREFIRGRSVSFERATTMRVIKRNGDHEDVSFDKILVRLKKLADHEPSLDAVKVDTVAQKVIQSLYDGVRTAELDDLAAETAVGYLTTHPQYGDLASRIAVSNNHKSTSSDFAEVTATLLCAGIVTKEYADHIAEHEEAIAATLDYARDYAFDFFGFKTLERSYLHRVKGVVVERPQHMWMRVAFGIHGSDLASALETYEGMSTKRFTHATPTLFNAGTARPQMSSCFLLGMDDSIASIYKTLGDCAQISKFCGGIGLNVSNVRASGSFIRGTNGKSSGIVPMLKVFNDTARYVNQGGKRLGSFAMYLEPWHPDVVAFLDLRKNTGNEYERARDLFLALWIPDLFMERVRDDGVWSLFCPNEAEGLVDAHGDEFRALYERYEEERRYVKQIKAQTLWFKILDACIETGTPYLGFKDSVNRKTNQENLGTVRNSNLCHEITQFSGPEETAVCNLASVCLPAFADPRSFDFEALHRTVARVVRNLDLVIDRNFYPTIEAKTSNMRHRPMGVGVQGLADVYAIMRLPWESPEARELNKKIFRHLYYAALDASCDLALEKGAYESFAGSPASEGNLQFDLWGVEPEPDLDWASLKARIRKHGLRNSLCVALMPTASTAQIFGNNEAFEPFTSNLYVRRVLSGEFTVINKHLVRDLVELGVWSPSLKDKIVRDEGSVQGIPEIPAEIRALYKTAYEISMRSVIDQAADRGAYVCQSQSLNLFVSNERLNYKSLSSMFFHNWESGNKGSYYLRTRPATNAKKITLECENCSA